MMTKFFKGCSCCLVALLLFFCFSNNSHAMSITSTYADLTSTSSQVENLYSLAKSYDSFEYADFVIFRDAQYSYYIVWGDLTHSSGTVTGSDIEYINYYATTTSSYGSNYVYDYDTDNTFSLKSSYIVVSNLDDYGMRYTQFETDKFQRDSVVLLVFVLSLLFALMLKSFRR